MFDPATCLVEWIDDTPFYTGIDGVIYYGRITHKDDMKAYVSVQFAGSDRIWSIPDKDFYKLRSFKKSTFFDAMKQLMEII